MSVAAAKVVGPTDGNAGFLGSIGVRFMIDGAEAGDRFSLRTTRLGSRPGRTVLSDPSFLGWRQPA